MNDEKLEKANELSLTIKELKANLEKAKSMKAGHMCIEYANSVCSLSNINFVSLGLRKNIKEMIIADLERQLNTLKTEYENL